MARRDVISSWQFTDSEGTFLLDNPHATSYLYFPLVNESGLMSSITPTLHGDIKTGLNEFLMLPVSVEDLHNTRSARNFWVHIPGVTPWSAAGNSARQIADGAGETVTLEAGLLWHTITRENREIGLRAEITNVVPAGHDQVELMRVSLHNISGDTISLTPTAAIPIYGRSADNLRDHRHVTSLLHRIQTTPYGVLVQPSLAFDERGHVPNTVTYGVLGVTADGGRPVEFFPVVEDFIGEGGSLDWPAAIVDPESVPGQPAGQAIDGYEALGGLRFEAIRLDPGQTREYILILAVLKDGTDPQVLIEKYGSADGFSAALESCRAYWQAKANALTFCTADPTFDQWMKWVGVQPVLRRLFGNSFLPYHDYGRGGRGWRDLWQDCLALLLTEPDDVPTLLHHNFAGVRFDGSNATIIGAAGQFIADRNNIPRVWMDHALWPYLTTRLYLDQSGDLGFLLREQTYFKDPQINRCAARDHDWTPDQGTLLRDHAGQVVQGTVLEHMLVQHLTSFFHVGEHNIIRLEGADWNDGMDMARTRGESVAFTAFYASNLRDLSRLVLDLGQSTIELSKELLYLLDTLEAPVDYNSVAAKQERLAAYFAICQHTISGEKISVPASDLALDLEAKAVWMIDHLRRQEWITNRDGFSWFNAYYDDDGQRVEGDHPDGVRMTLTGQVFMLIGGIATDAQAREIARTADRYLWEPSMGGYRLNTDFGSVLLNLGRCFGYAFGHKENGAMFSHMAIMYANALYQRGLVPEGYKVIDGIYQHCRDFATSRIYPGIPEYVSPRGRGMYPYLTGSASWLLLTLANEIFGVKGHLGDLVLEPKLAAGQFDSDGCAQVNLLFAGRRLSVTYHNPARLDYGSYTIKALTLDGAAVPAESFAGSLKLARSAITALHPDLVHQLVIELGPA